MGGGEVLHLLFNIVYLLYLVNSGKMSNSSKFLLTAGAEKEKWKFCCTPCTRDLKTDLLEVKIIFV